MSSSQTWSIDEIMGYGSGEEIGGDYLSTPSSRPSCHSVEVLSDARDRYQNSVIDLVFGSGSSAQSAGRDSGCVSPVAYRPRHEEPAVDASLKDTLDSVCAELSEEEEEDEQEDAMLDQISNVSEESDMLDDETDDEVEGEDGDDEPPYFVPLSPRSGRGCTNGKAAADAAESRSCTSPCTKEPTDNSCTLSCTTEPTDNYKMVCGSVQTQVKTHHSRARSCFSGWECRCNIAKSRGSACCLTEFSAAFLIQLSKTTYHDGEHGSVKSIKRRVHEMVWQLRVPLTEASSMGKAFSVPCWKLNGIAVCKAAFMMAVGGTKYAFREGLALTLLGKPPECYAAARVAAKATKGAAIGKVKSARFEWAASWWKRHLMYQDWLPNEPKIQYRGPKWTWVHKEFYAKEAQAANSGVYLKMRSWMRALPMALKELKTEYYPNERRNLALVRSARHSNFPECNDCQNLRREYIDAATGVGADTKLVAEKYEAMMEHHREWMAGRSVALEIRRLAEQQRSSSRCERSRVVL